MTVFANSSSCTGLPPKLRYRPVKLVRMKQSIALERTSPNTAEFLLPVQKGFSEDYARLNCPVALSSYLKSLFEYTSEFTMREIVHVQVIRSAWYILLNAFGC